MPNYNQIYKATVTDGGGTVNLDVTSSTTTRYIFSGTATLAAGYVVQASGTPVEGMEFDIRWQAVVTTAGANVVTVFGTVLTTDQALNDLIISCYYNGSAWDVDIQQDGVQEVWENGSGGTNTAKLVNGGTSTASASGAVNAGVNNTVSGANSFSAGISNTSSGARAVSFGNASTASGDDSISGGSATASSANSIAIGASTTSATNTYAIAIGENCDASGSHSGAFGKDNQVSANRSFSLGEDCDITASNAFSTGLTNDSTAVGAFTCGTVNTASGLSSFASGINGTASGDYSMTGGNHAKSTRYGQFSRASGSIDGNSSNYAQLSKLTCWAETTDASATLAELNGANGGSGITIPSSGIAYFRIEAVAIQVAGAAGVVGESASWHINGCIKNVAGTTSLVDTARYQDNTGAWGAAAQRTQDAGIAAITLVPTANNGTDTLDITVTGEANKTIYWLINVELTEIKYTP